MPKPPCRVCNRASEVFYRDARTFYRCGNCSLIFTNETAPPPEQEKHYKSQWGNQQSEFWKEQAEAILQIIRRYHEPRHILDFGAGSGALTDELRKRGLDCTPLEPMLHGFLKDQKYFHKFDVIVGVEVIEHLPNLWDELREMEKVLAPGGIMLFTTLLTEAFINAPDAAARFKEWWYKDDQTHVTFFGYRSLEVLGDIAGYDVDVVVDKVIVFKKKSGNLFVA
ncbi:MAG: class I SAM-dependent methyltransferase [Nitrospinae bacterium]|nr:class I SAM-dependent methyltransferase [Nitrospinota bacterium]